MKLTSLLSIEAIPTKLGRLLTTDSHLTKFQMERALDASIEAANKAFELHSFEAATHYNPDGSRTEKNETMQILMSAEPPTEEHDTVCRTGNPAVIGWYHAYAYNSEDVYRYWNGLSWSEAIVSRAPGSGSDYADGEFKKRRDTTVTAYVDISWTNKPVPSWILEREAKLYPAVNKASRTREEVVWHEGAPGQIGWYIASLSRNLTPHFLYFWDGQVWHGGRGASWISSLASDRMLTEFKALREHGRWEVGTISWTNLPVPQAILDLEEKLFPKTTDLLNDKTRPQGWYRFTDTAGATYFRYYDNMSGSWSSFLSEFEAGALSVTEIEGRTRSIPGLTTAAILKNGSIVISLDNMPKRLLNWF